MESFHELVPGSLHVLITKSKRVEIVKFFYFSYVLIQFSIFDLADLKSFQTTNKCFMTNVHLEKLFHSISRFLSPFSIFFKSRTLGEP